MKRIGVLTSGGDAPGMNPAIRAVVRSGIYYDMEVYGIRRGFEGLIHDEIHKMDLSSVGGIIQRGGTVLRTARSEEFRTDKGIDKAIANLNKHGIEGLVIIGGDGSLRGGLDLSKKGFPVIGIPATIDNDLNFSDFSIGFDTAVNTVLGAISNIRDTSESHDQAAVIEVMGRSTGHIAVYAGLTGGADSILIPELPLDIGAVCDKLVKSQNRGKMYSIIVKAEGVDVSSADLARKIKQCTGIETRIVVLGHVQRGGSPTARDRMIASRMGYEATVLLRDNMSGKAVGLRGMDLKHYDLDEALKIEKGYDDFTHDLADILSI